MNDWQAASYLSLSTQKRDGTWVNTPVWFACHDGVFYLFSEGKAGKVKRIRNFADVNICPCSVTGKLQGTWQTASARLLESDEGKRQAHAALLKKYGWQLRLLDWGASLAGKKSKRAFICVTVSD